MQKFKCSIIKEPFPPPFRLVFSRNPNPIHLTFNLKVLHTTLQTTTYHRQPHSSTSPTFPSTHSRTSHPHPPSQHEAPRSHQRDQAADAVYISLDNSADPSFSTRKHNCPMDQHSGNRTCQFNRNGPVCGSPPSEYAAMHGYRKSAPRGPSRATATFTSNGGTSRPVPLQHDPGVLHIATRPTLPLLFLLGERRLFSIARRSFWVPLPPSMLPP